MDHTSVQGSAGNSPWQNSAPEGINSTPVASQKSKEQDSVRSSSTVTSPGCFRGPEDCGMKVPQYIWWGERNTRNRQAGRLLPSQRQSLPKTRAKSLAFNAHMLVHQSPLKLSLKKLPSGTSRSFTAKLNCPL